MPNIATLLPNQVLDLAMEFPEIMLEVIQEMSDSFTLKNDGRYYPSSWVLKNDGRYYPNGFVLKNDGRYYPSGYVLKNDGKYYP